MKIPHHHHQQQQQQTPITVNGRNLKEVTSFTYLGSTVSTTGGTDEDVKVRIGKARQAFISLKPVWRSSALHSACGTRYGFSTPTSSQCFCMVERLGALRKGFPINYRHSSTTAYAGSLLKIR
ncbi:unnamed protein product [Heterobilharzia americana]|nr:unnamed protein product [Heterobilharzia americana]